MTMAAAARRSVALRQLESCWQIDGKTEQTVEPILGFDLIASTRS